jgi:hypothetical protein
MMRPVWRDIFYAIVAGIVIVTFKSKKSIVQLYGQQIVVFFCLCYYYPSITTRELKNCSKSHLYCSKS